MIIGLTGSIGSGKSTAAKIFAKKGFKVIDADRISHGLLRKNSVKNNIVRYFGNGVLTKNEIDRKKLGLIVFSSSAKLKKINSIMHPLILKEVSFMLKKYKSRNVVVDIPLLFESKSEKMFDKIVVVVAENKEIIRRNTGFSDGEIKRISRFQMPIQEKIRHADYVIENSFGPEKLERQVVSIIQKLRIR